jgi:hypothetical protein
MRLMYKYENIYPVLELEICKDKRMCLMHPVVAPIEDPMIEALCFS